MDIILEITVIRNDILSQIGILVSFQGLWLHYYTFTQTTIE